MIKIFRLILLCLSFYAPLSATVIAFFRGQFGNQLFQVAAAVALAQENNCGIYFPDFDCFNKPYNIEIQLEKNYNLLFHRIPNRVSAVPIHSIYFDFVPNSNYRPIPYQPNIEINGYFLSEKFFKKSKDLILELFAAPKEVEEYLNEHHKWILEHPKTVAIHVRTGYLDYKYCPNKPRFYTVYLPPDMEYFKKGMSLFDEDALFIVFSDNIEWCKGQFKDMDRNIIFMEGQDYIYDFYLLSKCKNAIIANSSFSWWAAYLINNPDRKIVCRYPFIGPYTPDVTPQDMICEDWITIAMPDIPPVPKFDDVEP